MKKVFTWIWRILLVLVTVVALIILASGLPIKGNYQFMIVESGSMEPAIKTGSILAYLPRADYQVGDITTFKGTEINSTPTTHRIVDTVEEGGQTFLVTKGDANEDVDYRRISKEEILGEVLFSIPHAGYAAVYFGTPAGRSLLVTSVLVLLVITLIPWRKLIIKETKEND